MEPTDFFRLLRRRWRLLLACLVVPAAIVWFLTPSEPPEDAVTYVASTTLLRDSTAVTTQPAGTVMLFMRTGKVPERVAERVGFSGNPALLAAQLDVTPDETLGTVEVSVTGPTKDEAAERANAFAEETVAFLSEQAQQAQQEQLAPLAEQVSTLQGEIAELDREILQGDTSGLTTAERDAKMRQYSTALDLQQQLLNQPAPRAGYVILEEALPQLASVDGGGFAIPTGRPPRAALALLGGLVLGLAAVFAADRLDTRLQSRRDAERAFRLPVLAEVPRVPTKGKHKTLVLDTDPTSGAAEAYRSLRSAAVLTGSTVLGTELTGDEEWPELQVLLVTSPGPGEGKTSTVANLATAFAETGRSVLILSCDFRRPEIHRYFSMQEGRGIAEVLTSGGKLELADVVQQTGIPQVLIALSGNKLGSLGDVAATGRDLVHEARNLADIVIIDTSPLLATNDATELIPACDSVILVSRLGRTSVEDARRTRQLLERLLAPVLGVLLLDTRVKRSRYGGYYHAPPSRPRHRRREEPAQPTVPAAAPAPELEPVLSTVEPDGAD